MCTVKVYGGVAKLNSFLIPALDGGDLYDLVTLLCGKEL